MPLLSHKHSLHDETTHAQNLSCPICREPFEQPKKLLDFHKSCQHCHKTHDSPPTLRNILRCESCACITTITTRGNDIIINKLKFHDLPTIFIKHNCHSCHAVGIKTDATCACLECPNYFCNICGTKHTALKPYNHHKVIRIHLFQPAIETVNNRPEKYYDACPQHGEMLGFHCRKCQLPIQVTCQTIN